MVDITISYHNVYPPRNVITVSGLTAGVDFLAIYRRVAGVETLIRGGAPAGTVPDTAYVAVDDEYPFNISTVYVAVVNATDRYETAPDVYTLPGGKVVLSDAITGLAVETAVMAMDTRTRDRAASVFRVAGRNIVVSGDLGQFESDIQFFTETDTAAAQFLQLMTEATGAVVQMRGPNAVVYSNFDAYFAVVQFQEQRWSQDGTDERRTWLVHAVETNPWASSLDSARFTYGDVVDFYSPTSGTYADLLSDFGSYLDVLTADWS